MLLSDRCSSSSTSAAPVALELDWPALELVFCRTSLCTGRSPSQLPSPSPVKSNGSASGKGYLFEQSVGRCDEALEEPEELEDLEEENASGDNHVGDSTDMTDMRTDLAITK